MNKSLLFRSIFIGFISGIVLYGVSVPHTINADLQNVSVTLSPATLIHNGHLTVQKIDKSSYEVVKTIKKAVVTGYSSTVDQTDSRPWETASGFDLRTLKAGEGVVATNILPLGTKVRIAGQIYTVEDRMNARYNGKNRFDIYFPGEELGRKAALKFGAQLLKVEIIES